MSIDLGTEGVADERSVFLVNEDLVRDVAATAGQVTIVRHALGEWLRARGLPTDTMVDILLAATEAMANVVDHAYLHDPHGTLTVTASDEPGFVTITVVDTGQWKDGVSQTGRGQGMIIMRAVAPEAAVISTPTGTTVRLTWPWVRDLDAGR